MAEDASLDDFLVSGDSEDEGDGGSASGDVTAETEREPTDAGVSTDSEAPADAVEPAEASAETVKPAVTTYAWSPAGAACAECGEVVERRWTQDGALVCGACKRW